MKVLYIDVNCKNSSTGQIVYSLFSKCKDNGIDSAVCYGRGPKIKEDGIYKFGLDIETRFHALMTRITGYTGCFSFFSTRRLIKFIKRFKPDIVHIHELHAYFVNIKPLLRYLAKNNIKTIFTNHCDFLFTGKCGVAHPCNKYVDGCRNCPKKKDYPKSLLFDRTTKMWNEKKMLFGLFNRNNVYLTGPSEFIIDRLSKTFLSRFRKKVIPNFIDSFFFLEEDFNKEEFKNRYNIPLDKKVVLMIASNAMSELKGGNKFIELAKSMSDSDYYFVLIGAKAISLSNCLILEPIFDKKVLSHFYNIAYCSVILSSYESFSLISAESQCCGTPVLFFDVGGIKENVVESSASFGFQYNDLEGIKKTLVNNELTDVDRKKISSIALSRFSIDSVFNKYLNLYKDLCH